ncbi:MAG TPA: copper transporter [Actinomycetota bacterium]|nr:copper transporter [Actinomycetota bacterium]
MIDFRYHLISIVAVFLALGIGILMGSVVLDQSLVRHLENQLDGIEQTNEALRGANQDLRDEVQVAENFALGARALLLPGAVEGGEVVLVTFAGTDAAVLDAVRAGIDEAGGDVAGSLIATEKLALSRDPERDQLSLIVNAVTSTPEGLLSQTGSVLGDRASAAAVAPPDGGAGVAAGGDDVVKTQSPAQRLEELLAELSEAGFVEVDPGRDDVVVPAGAGFVVVAGSDSRPPFEVADFTLSFSTALASSDVAVVVAEASSSAWGLTEMIRADDEAQRVVTTVDQAESTSGTIATVLAYAQAKRGCTGQHYGVNDGAAGIIPRPADDC